jgi:hypothetical protein
MFRIRSGRRLGFRIMQMRIAFLTLCIAGSLSTAVHSQSLSGPTLGSSRYAVGGLALGCAQRRVDHTNDGNVTTVNSILHRQDGTVVYVNRAVFPEHFDRNEFDRVVENLSKRYGQTAEIIRMPKRQGIADAIIAFWGAVKLIPLENRDSLNVLRSGGQVSEGILVDLLGDYARSVKQGLPIYRLSGGGGYVWAATRSDEGRGHVRFFAINVAEFLPAEAHVPPEHFPPPTPSRPPDTPDACKKFPQLC